MKVTIQDKATLSELSLVDIRAYLTTQGWSADGRYGNVATIFTRTGPDGLKREILLPMKAELADYSERMADIVAVLAEVEARSQLAVYHDLVKAGFDIIRVRALEADDAGTIPLDDGVLLYDKAREMIVASANAAVKPKRAYRGSSPDIAREYLSSLRLGQTEVGSYVLTVLSPVPPALQSEQMNLFPGGEADDDPFARLVTRQLDSALRAAMHAVAEATASGKLEPFEAAVQSGVSANLCDAIAKIAEHGAGTDISISWSRARPRSSSREVFRFTKDNARVLTEAAAAFRDREPLADVTVDGFVVGLRREPSEFEGKARIRGFLDGNGGLLDGKMRTLTASFLPDDYRRVVDAHDRKLRVRIDGEVVRRGVVPTLENPRNLIVFEDESDSLAAE